MPDIVTDALVLRRSEYRDYDRMVTLLSPEFGRIEAVARGCRRPKSPLMNATEVFSAGEYTITLAKERYTLTQCQIRENYYALRSDVDKLTHAAYYLHLLLLSVMPDEPSEGLFLLALKALAFLNYSELPPSLVTLAFEMHYMAITGQSPRMDGCVICGRSISGDAKFDPSAGGTVCEFCHGGEQVISNGARRILLRAPRTKFDSVALLSDRAEWPEAAACMRAFVAYRIESTPKMWPEIAIASGGD